MELNVYQDSHDRIKLSHRKLLGSATLAGLAACFHRGDGGHHSKRQKPPSRAVMLFRGDSITDAGRDKRIPSQTNKNPLGRLCLDGRLPVVDINPSQKLTLHNRGISGNKVHQHRQMG